MAMWWGFSPAIDLLDEVPGSTVNVLLIGQSDCRHVLQTLARRYRHRECENLRLYVYEPRLENIARSLLFCTLALDNKLGIASKTQYFLELYGNTLVRQSTWQYFTEATNRLIKIVTNFNYAQNVLPSISLDNLKYKERDNLENIFKFWIRENSDLDLVKFWDSSVRSLLGTRYDSRGGVFDWDLHMRYRPFGGEAVSAPEYKRFREKGVSFFQDDTDPCISNVTLTSFQQGSMSPLAGYLGDIVTGPYTAFGVTSEDKDLFKKVNGHMWKNSTEISEYNLQKLFHEIAHGTPFKPVNDIDAGCPELRQDESQKLQTKKPVWRRLALGDTYSSLPTKGSELTFLPLTALKDYPNKQQFQGMFDLVVAPHTVLPQLQPNWTALCKNNCTVLVESGKFILSMRKDDLLKSKTSIDDLMKDVNFEPFGTYEFKEDSFMKYRFAK